MSINDFSDQEFRDIVESSTSYSDVIRKLGYKSIQGRNQWTVQKRITELSLDTTHFNFIPGKQRTDEELFVKDSDARNKVVRERLIKRRYFEYKCDICQQAPKWNGKPLTLILDHKNGNNTDHRLENLRWVCPNCNSQLPTTGFVGIKKFDEIGNKLKEDVPITQPQYNFCSECGTIISRGATRCVHCNSKRKRISPADMLVTRDELKELIRTTPFKTIGQLYNVTDNTIRKWCIKLNLPYKSSEIKLIADDEWIKI